MSFSELRKLLYPPFCVVCGRGSADICPACESSLESFTHVGRLHNLPLYSALHYSESASHMILAAKESNNRACSRYMASLMVHRFSRLHRDFSLDRYTLIPIPSSKRSDAKRGFSHTSILAKLLRSEVERRFEVSISIRELLTPTRAIADQSGLNAVQREINIHKAFRVTSTRSQSSVPLKPDLTGTGIILIDDLVTTGSTMGEAIRALKEASIKPAAMLSACVAGRFLANRIGT